MSDRFLGKNNLEQMFDLVARIESCIYSSLGWVDAWRQSSTPPPISPQHMEAGPLRLAAVVSIPGGPLESPGELWKIMVPYEIGVILM